MERISATDQFQINEIIKTLGNWHLDIEQIGKLEEIIFKISKEFEGFQMWIYVTPGKDFKIEDLSSTTLIIESFPNSHPRQNVFFRTIPNRDINILSGSYKRKSRKPGPDLRPH